MKSYRIYYTLGMEYQLNRNKMIKSVKLAKELDYPGMTASIGCSLIKLSNEKWTFGSDYPVEFSEEDIRLHVDWFEVEYVDEPSLQDRFKEGGIFTEDEFAHLTKLRGLEYVPYQLCPKCEARHLTYIDCDICHGKKIIPMGRTWTDA